MLVFRFSHTEFYNLQAIRHFDITFFLMFAACAITLLNLFMYCYYGKVATDSLLAYSDSVYNSNWSQHPIGIRKAFIVIIAYAQRPQLFNGFGLVSLKLETFSKVFAKSQLD